jgi:DnaJ-class molecular chaperone
LGNASDSLDMMNGDLLVKVMVENSDIEGVNMKRINDDIVYDLDLNLVEAIFGAKKEIKTFDKEKEIIEVKPGSQSEDKIIFQNRV